jgi:O-antigen/teichoic acid export membrane protein
VKEKARNFVNISPSLFQKLKLGRDRTIRLSRESAWLISGQILGILGSLALLRVTTNYLAPQEYGQLTLVLTVGVFVCQVSLSGVMPGIMRYYTIAAERGDISNFTNASYRLMAYGVMGTILLSCLVSFSAFLADRSGWIGGILLAIGFTQISSFNSTLSAIQNAARQRNLVVLHGVVDPWIKIGLLLLLVKIIGSSVNSVILAYLLTALLMLSSQLFFYRRLMRLIPNKEQLKLTPWLKEMVNYSKPFMVFNHFTWLQASSDRWSLERFTTTQVVGEYAVLSQLGNAPVSMAVNMITNLIGPILQQRSGDATDIGRNRNVWRISWLITLFGLGITAVAFLLTFFLHSWLFNLLVAQDYHDKSFLLPWVVLGGGLFAASQILSIKLMSDMNTRALIAPKLITSILAVGFNVLGAGIWGLEGVVGAQVMFSLLIFAWMTILTKRPHSAESNTGHNGSSFL